LSNMLYKNMGFVNRLTVLPVSIAISLSLVSAMLIHASGETEGILLPGIFYLLPTTNPPATLTAKAGLTVFLISLPAYAWCGRRMASAVDGGISQAAKAGLSAGIVTGLFVGGLAFALNTVTLYKMSYTYYGGETAFLAFIYSTVVNAILTGAMTAAYPLLGLAFGAVGGLRKRSGVHERVLVTLKEDTPGKRTAWVKRGFVFTMWTLTCAVTGFAAALLYAAGYLFEKSRIYGKTIEIMSQVTSEYLRYMVGLYGMAVINSDATKSDLTYLTIAVLTITLAAAAAGLGIGLLAAKTVGRRS